MRFQTVNASTSRKVFGANRTSPSFEKAELNCKFFSLINLTGLVAIGSADSLTNNKREFSSQLPSPSSKSTLDFILTVIVLQRIQTIGLCLRHVNRNIKRCVLFVRYSCTEGSPQAFTRL